MRRTQLTPHWVLRMLVVCLGAGIACNGSIVDSPPSEGGGSNAGASGGNGSGTAAGTAGATSPNGVAGASGSNGGASSSGGPTSGGGNATASCEGSDLTAAKRIVRLSFNQVANSIGALLNISLTQKLIDANDILDVQHRAFPPLQSPREGNAVTDATWKTLDSMAAEAGKYVFDNFAAVTSCGTAPTDACAQQYLSNLAAKAFRRSLTTAEQGRITKLYSTTLKGVAGTSIQEAVQYGVYAILQSPQFVYRTEFGSDWTTDGRLASSEIASSLALFLTDSLPDQQLLDAAAQDKLSTADEIGAQVDRILKTDAAKKNLHGAMMSYFAYPQLETVKIDDAAFTEGVRNSMYHEAELFLKNTLWGGQLSDILLSKKSVMNASLAKIYGVSQFPASGATLDADGFGPVDLPSNRMGLLTQAGFLTTRSRPDKTSVVGRGLLIKNALLCSETPEPPASITDAIAAISAANENASERELANIRGTMSPCNGCHQTFDAYGLAVDTYDVIGRYRSVDPQGRPIDTTVTLPDQVGGGSAKDALEVAAKIAASGGFAKCMGRNLINYSLADVSAGAADINGCAAAHVAESFEKTDRSFSSLVKSVAISTTFASRSKGATQ